MECIIALAFDCHSSSQSYVYAVACLAGSQQI